MLRTNPEIQKILAASIGSGVPFMNNLTFMGFLLLMFGLCGMQVSATYLPPMYLTTISDYRTSHHSCTATCYQRRQEARGA